MKSESRNLTWAWLLVAVLYFALGTQSAMAVPGTIVGTKHDLSTTGTSGLKSATVTQICIFCHAPHGGSTSAPLWNRALTGNPGTYTLYSKVNSGSSTLDATPAGPGSISKLCLSCHDGTVAVDSYTGSAIGTKFMTAAPAANLGTNLANTHPIGFTYDAALVTADGGLYPTTTAATIGSANTGTIATKLLFGGQVECASCHDVHNSTGGTADTTNLVRISMVGSKLCLACHVK